MAAFTSWKNGKIPIRGDDVLSRKIHGGTSLDSKELYNKVRQCSSSPDSPGEEARSSRENRGKWGSV